MPSPSSSHQRRGGPETLAYVFFHRPGVGVRRPEYERAVLAFHTTLARDPTPGFRGSALIRIPRAPWEAGRGSPLYVDWYVLRHFSDLDPIRDVAYRPPWVDAHRTAARMFGDGGGALYAARGQAAPPSSPGIVAWFSAPEGRGRSILSRWWGEGPPRGVLWRRQLALGPSPEFCYFGPVAPPASLAPAFAVVIPEYLPVPPPAAAGPK